jgi:hypothetical protein
MWQSLQGTESSESPINAFESFAHMGLAKLGISVEFFERAAHRPLTNMASSGGGPQVEAAVFNLLVFYRSDKNKKGRSKAAPLVAAICAVTPGQVEPLVFADTP